MAEQGLTEDVLRKAKRYSFTDSVIARYANTTVEEVRAKRKEWNILPTYKYVDTCAANLNLKRRTIIVPMRKKMKLNH